MSRTVLASITLLGVAIAVGAGGVTGSPANTATWQRTGRHPKPAAMPRCSIGTTRWFLSIASTGPANHPSWTWIWCRATPARTVTRRPSASTSASPRISACAWPRSGVVARKPHRCSGRARIQRPRRGAGADARRRLRRARLPPCTGRPDRKGAPLADLLIPEWAAAQEEYLALRRAGDAALLDAARQRLRLAGMPASTISRLERSGKIDATISVIAPLAGVLQELEVREGMTLAAGAPLARINGLDSVWLESRCRRRRVQASRLDSRPQHACRRCRARSSKAR